ncbi:hypothetical protein BK636_03500 [Pseudomonas chlororaphis]|uniref:hypothetical protein n=1 Tax=Pseudomonas chlororaphis TaxID=587753 RepID=UPI000F46E293|nr:hypothetical protein [Pseudomonas chlororaphis]ROL85559.1 hypothetical protein BK637_21325 [Pseudomonas chlororaphis]ROL90527.1 hypothetical protein BK636_03500 [Pseudomonas chlororaphis]
MDIQSLGWTVAAFVAGLLLKSFLPGYFKKKAENLATKEDIADITQKIETVKHEYATQLESAKADLSVLVTRHGFRYEKEYDVLGRLTELLVELRDASVGLRPVVDFRDPDLSADEVKQQRLARLHEAGRMVYLESQRKRPFFPGDIYDSIEAILKITHSESIEYRLKDPFEGEGFMEYWESAEKNQNAITQSVEDAMELIRNRVIKWDSDRP